MSKFDPMYMRNVIVSDPDKDRIATVSCKVTGHWARVRHNENGTLFWLVDSSLQVSTPEPD